MHFGIQIFELQSKIVYPSNNGKALISFRSRIINMAKNIHSLPAKGFPLMKIFYHADLPMNFA